MLAAVPGLSWPCFGGKRGEGGHPDSVWAKAQSLKLGGSAGALYSLRPHARLQRAVGYILESVSERAGLFCAVAKRHTKDQSKAAFPMFGCTRTPLCLENNNLESCPWVLIFLCLSKYFPTLSLSHSHTPSLTCRNT